MNELQQWFDALKFECRPNKDLTHGVGILNEFLKTDNFVGGINDKRNTLHENLFSAMFPHLKKQVHFGTDKGGYEKYLSKRYTADFYNETTDEIYEIDGSSHKTELQKLKDNIRDIFFWQELGIKTVRLSNQDVETMVMNRLQKLFEEDKLNV